MSYSAEMEPLTTWFMVGGGIVFLFSLVACLRPFAGDGENVLPKTLALVGFWLFFFGAFMDPRLGAFW